MLVGEDEGLQVPKVVFVEGRDFKSPQSRNIIESTVEEEPAERGQRVLGPCPGPPALHPLAPRLLLLLLLLLHSLILSPLFLAHKHTCRATKPHLHWDSPLTVC